MSDKTAERFADQEAELVPLLAPLAAADVAVAMRQWKALAEADLGDDEPKGEPESSLHLSSLLEGRWRLDGDLGALDGEMLATALRLASAKDAKGEVRTPAQRRAAAMIDICSFLLQRHDHPAGSRHRPHVNVIVNLEDLEAGRGGTFADGVVIDGPSLASLVCHSVWHRVLVSGSSSLDFGTRPHPAPRSTAADRQRPNPQRRTGRGRRAAPQRHTLLRFVGKRPVCR